MSDESIAINPDEIQKRKERKPKELEKVEINDNREFEDRAGKVVVNLESKGRFGESEKLIFDDYTTEHIAKLTLSNSEDLLEILVNILNELQEQDNKINFAEMTNESFMECLIAIKNQFSGPLHTHYWMCDCQLNNAEDQREYCETTINLSEINYISIEEVDEKIRNKIRPILESMSEEQFKDYLLRRYQYDPLDDLDSWTREDEIQNTTIKEPFFYKQERTGKIFGFRLMRIGDIIQGYKIAKKKFEQQKYAIKHKKAPHGVKLAEFKSEQQKELEELEKKEMQECITCINGLSLISIDGNPLPEGIERIELYRKLKRHDLFEINNFLEEIKFGINHKMELQCSFCGKIDGRWLQQSSHPLEFLPLDSNTKRNKREHISSNIYFSV